MAAAALRTRIENLLSQAHSPPFQGREWDVILAQEAYYRIPLEAKMFRKTLSVLILISTLAAVAAAQDAKTVIANASKAMGYDQLKSIEYSGSGFEGTAMGQAQSATAGWPKFTLKNFSRYVDLNAGTSQQNALRSRPADATGQLPGGGGLAPVPESQQTTTINANAPWAQKLDISLSPPGFLKLADAAANATAKPQSVNGKKYTVVSFTTDAKAPSGVPYTIRGYIDAQNMLDKVETAIEEPNVIGDMTVEQTFSAYKDFGGVKFPTKIVQKRAGLSWTDLTITDVKANAAAPAPPAPPAGRGGGGGRGGARGEAPAPPPMTAKKLGEGIYMTTGGYRSVAIEFKDHIVLIEAPNNEMTSANIIAEVKKAIPNKPIKYVVNTHTHFDHSGGLRAAVAEGAVIITHESNKPLYEKWFSNPRTLVMPDKLSQSEKKAKFEYIGEKKILKDEMNTVELYHLKGVAHSEDLIVAYLPKIKTVVEADAFNAPAPNAPPPQTINGFEKLFASEMDRLKIDYSTIIPIHQPAGGDREITKADLLKNIGRGN
jgi:glyoxylase-like metal-dependent hydrolase (beta-lactamase superfamily II)